MRFSRLVPLLLALASSCTTREPSGTAPSASASTSASASVARPEVSAPPERDEDDVKPVYPMTRDPPDPMAQRYCDLMHEVSEKKRKECCPNTPFTPFRPTGECVRTLSYALRSKALVLAQADLDACEAAVMEEAKSCDWAGATVPACVGIVRGQVEEKALCRSSLECKEGLFCAGLGATTPGKCRKPLPEGLPCGGSTDTLSAFIRQDSERRNPQCEGYCSRRRCAKTTAIGQACTSSLECGADRSCINGKCSDAPLPGAGQPCAKKLCGAGLACVKGKCAAPRRINEECASDEECRSNHCERPAARAGKCAMSCQIIRPK